MLGSRLASVVFCRSLPVSIKSSIVAVVMVLVEVAVVAVGVAELAKTVVASVSSES